MTKISLFVASFLMVTTTVGCGGGNSGAIQTSGVRCNADGTAYDPIPLDKAGAKKVSLKSGTPELPEGKYIYNGAEIYYYNSNTKMQAHFTEDAAKTSSKPVCVRNASTTPFTESKVGVSSFTVKPFGAVEYQLRNYNFSFDGNKLFFKFEDDVNTKSKSIEDVYVSKGSQLQFYEVSPSNYEVRSSQTKDGVRVDFVIRYAKAPGKTDGEDLPPPNFSTNR